VVVFRICDAILNMGPFLICRPLSGFIIAPLPAKKALWEAQNAQAWTSCLDWNTRDEDDFGLMEDGTLVRLDRILPLEENGIRGEARDIRPADWADWCSGMDGFGALIMVAASLL
jgi:hypothetical protein